MNYIIETKNLTKEFHNKIAANHINMHIQAGEIYGFIGKNGAGKTTTMKLLLGMELSTSGEIVLFGNKNLNEARKHIGGLIEAPGIYKNCSAYENLKRFSVIYGGTEQEIQEILTLVGLSDTGKKPAGKFSLGMRQRLGIAIALLGNPKLLILDEPINGLDPAGIKEIRDLILKINKDRNVTILISSHLLDELSKIVTTYGIINNGILIEEISSAELLSRCKQYFKLIVSPLEKAATLLKENFHFKTITIEENCIKITDEINCIPDVISHLVQNNIAVHEAAMVKCNLEDYFIERMV
ncbi:MAG: ATP-binding cassette domain-containing protein [bacterium]|nr:ATP-binding cassette domain-containing protein [bacterium]